LRTTTYNSSRLKLVVLLVSGSVAFLSVTVTAQAQTYYYYYPSSVTSAAGVTAGTNSVPTYYYRRGLFGRRYLWTGYAAPAYQATYSPQNPEPANPVQSGTQASPAQTGPANSIQSAAQDSPAQNLSVAQVIPTSYTTNDQEPAATTAPASTDAGDPYGFTGWLNATRAAYGLSPVGHDPNLSSWAAQNNAQQAARGIGHFVMGPARRQNSAFGSVSDIGTMWMSSAAHRAALLDPTIRWIGIAGLGAYWTFNAN
jgi:hypothetical protein